MQDETTKHIPEENDVRTVTYILFLFLNFILHTGIGP